MAISQPKTMNLDGTLGRSSAQDPDCRACDRRKTRWYVSSYVPRGQTYGHEGEAVSERTHGMLSSGTHCPATMATTMRMPFYACMKLTCSRSYEAVARSTMNSIDDCKG